MNPDQKKISIKHIKAHRRKKNPETFPNTATFHNNIEEKVVAVFVLIGVNCKSASSHEPLFQPKSPYVRLIRLKVFTVSKSVIRNEAFSEQITFDRVKVRSLSQVTGVYLSESAIREFTWINKELGSIFFDFSRVC